MYLHSDRTSHAAWFISKFYKNNTTVLSWKPHNFHTDSYEK